MSVIQKPSPTIPQCAYLVEQIIKEAGFNNNEYQILLADTEHFESIVGDPRVAGVSLTGSTRSGKSIGALAGKYVKPCLLELGGMDPFVVLEDADMKKSAAQAALGRLCNSGQVCVGAKRMIINEKVYDKFVEELIPAVKGWKVGDPHDPDTMMGPLARQDLYETVRVQVKESVEKGSKVLYGDVEQLKAPLPLEKGNFFYPMILENIPNGAPAKDGNNFILKEVEEIFGPCLSLFKVKNDEEAIALANNIPYGLG